MKPRWDTKKHDIGVSDRAAADAKRQRDQQIQGLDKRIKDHWKSWKRISNASKTIGDYLESVKAFKITLANLCEGFPEKEAWLMASYHILDQSVLHKVEEARALSAKVHVHPKANGRVKLKRRRR